MSETKRRARRAPQTETEGLTMKRQNEKHETRDRKRDRDGWKAKRQAARKNKLARQRFEREGPR